MPGRREKEKEREGDGEGEGEAKPARGRRSKARLYTPVGARRGLKTTIYSCTFATTQTRFTDIQGALCRAKVAMPYTVPRVFDRLKAVQLTASVVHARRRVELEKKKGM